MNDLGLLSNASLIAIAAIRALERLRESREDDPEALATLDRLLEAGVFPQPDPRWPALPWPPV